ncbi:MAG: phosphatidylinositol-specific phospholipase C1-like protein [Deltaproteobacteria bacterium]
MKAIYLLRRPLPSALVASALLGGCLDAYPRLNEIQVLGTHNSYHIQPRPSVLAALASFEPETAATLEYSHLPLSEQLDRGARQLELDVFADPEGGRYARRAGLLAVGENPESGLAELEEPGLKVLHIQDLDFETHCLSFVRCLELVRGWSRENPTHLPILIMVEAKQEAIDDPLSLGFVLPLQFGSAELDTIDAEIRSVFSEAELITPDEVRGSAATLERAVLTHGWPSVAAARGRVLFTLLNGDAARERYVDGHASLSGRAMFTTSEVGKPEAAFFNVNDALADGERIASLVSAGYLVRTRADIDTLQARSGDTSLQQAAFASGAQFVSTDYLVPDARFGTGYVAELPGEGVARCNPLAPARHCDPSRDALSGRSPKSAQGMRH